MQDAANALMAELATIDQHGFSAEELDDVKSTRLTWLKMRLISKLNVIYVC